MLSLNGKMIATVASVVMAIGVASNQVAVAQHVIDPQSVSFYSTAPPPLDYPGPIPQGLESNLADPRSSGNDNRGVDDQYVRPAELEPERFETDQSELQNFAFNPPEPSAPTFPPIESPAPTTPSLGLPTPEAEANRPADRNAPNPEAEPIAFAKAAIADCKIRYQSVSDYTCVFQKRERIRGRLSKTNQMLMKARTNPESVYFKFLTPTRGREAIYIHGANRGKAIVHDVGVGKLVGGTVWLDPRSRRAMEGNRHPITEAGIGNMIDKLVEGWDREMNAQDSVVEIKENIRVDGRPCIMIVSNHPERSQRFTFHEVRVYIDKELGLPIRFEGYDWPSRRGGKKVLLEEYTYRNLRLNVGLTARDFNPSNPSYSFGRL